ncbi:YihY/virulence factor BrkB family protein [Bacillus horti]|uniref:Membrane protein n=1 Tax=Caldalkalibacillus horti TaxID=77523 RepID=A0ABT9W1D5_9BACI|nr:YihY/virulence factor BrkB family protein [Bacillus horti]MDQ0167052.1 membrane protein [Bacillus horti]
MTITTAKNFAVELFRRFSAHRVPDLAAQLSYYFLLALFPFLIFTFTLLPYTPLASEDVLELIAQYIPLDSMEIVERNVRNILEVERGGLLSVSIIAAMWSASNGSYAVIRALNHAYDVEESRSFIKARLVAFMLMLALLLTILIALILPVFGRSLGIFLFSFMGMSETFLALWDAFRWIISFTVIFIVFSFLYLVAPNRSMSPSQVWVGALVATIGWQLISLGFSYYISNFSNYSATYGSLGGVIILLLWLFLMGMLIILGGEINATREVLSKKK